MGEPTRKTDMTCESANCFICITEKTQPRPVPTDKRCNVRWSSLERMPPTRKDIRMMSSWFYISGRFSKKRRLKCLSLSEHIHLPVRLAAALPSQECGSVRQFQSSLEAGK